MDLPLGAAYFNQLFNKEVFYSVRSWKDVARKIFPDVFSVVVVVFSILFSLPKQTFGS